MGSLASVGKIAKGHVRRVLGVTLHRGVQGASAFDERSLADS